jgi:hypothetical protein
MLLMINCLKREEEEEKRFERPGRQKNHRNIEQ